MAGGPAGHAPRPFSRLGMGTGGSEIFLLGEGGFFPWDIEAALQDPKT